MLKVFVINQTIFCATHLPASRMTGHTEGISLSSICITCKHTLSISVY